MTQAHNLVRSTVTPASKEAGNLTAALRQSFQHWADREQGCEIKD